MNQNDEPFIGVFSLALGYRVVVCTHVIPTTRHSRLISVAVSIFSRSNLYLPK